MPVRFIHFGTLAPEGRTRLEHLIHAESGEAATIEVAQAQDNVADAICARAAGSGVNDRASIIIMGALAREKAVRDLVGSTARRVARRAPCSVVLVSTAHDAAASWQRFFISVDGSTAARAMSETVLRIARTGGGSPEMCFIHEQPGEGPASLLATQDAAHNAPLTLQMSSFIGGLETAGLAVKAILLPGRPGQELARYAEDNRADFLAVIAPSKPIGFLGRLLSHPIVLLLDRLPCSVLLYRSINSSAAGAKD